MFIYHIHPFKYSFVLKHINNLFIHSLNATNIKSHSFIFEFLFMIPFHHIIIIQLSICDKQINNPQKHSINTTIIFL